MANRFAQFAEPGKPRENRFAKFAAQPDKDRSNPVSRQFEKLANITLPKPEGSNPVSEFFGDAAEASYTPKGNSPVDTIARGGARALEFVTAPSAREKIVEGVARGVGAIGKPIAEDPLKTLVVDPLTAPVRAHDKFGDAHFNATRGRPGEAGSDLIEALTATGETALLFGGPVAATTGKGAAASIGAGALARPVAKSASQTFLDNAAQAGIDPTLAARFPRTAGGFTKAVSDNPITGIAVEGQAKKIAGQAEEAVQRAAKEFSPNASVNETGATITDAAQRFARDRVQSEFSAGQRVASASAGKYRTFRDMSDALYDRVDKAVNLDAVAQPAKTAEAARRISDRTQNQALADFIAQPQNEKVRNIVTTSINAATRGEQLSIKDLRTLRTEIRNLQAEARANQTPAQAALQQLEGALTQDIYEAVKATGGQKALRDLQRADKFYGQGVERIESALRPFFKKTGTEEGAYKEIISAAKNPKDGGNAARIRTLRRTLKPEELDEVASGVIANLGKPRGGGEFSVETFAREWKALSPDAKQALFYRSDRPELMSNLDSLASVLEKQASVEALTNRSRSGAVATTFGLGGLFFAEPMTAIATAAGAGGLGRLMLSPTFTKAMLQTSDAVAAAPMKAAAFAPAQARAYSAVVAVENSDEAASALAREIRLQMEAQNDNLQQVTRENRR